MLGNRARNRAIRDSARRKGQRASDRPDQLRWNDVVKKPASVAQRMIRHVDPTSNLRSAHGASGRPGGLESRIPAEISRGSTFFISELFAKRLRMLEDIAPSLARAGLLALKPGPLADRPSAREASHYFDVVRAAAEALKIECTRSRSVDPRNSKAHS
jgi:hypothetical protein